VIVSLISIHPFLKAEESDRQAYPIDRSLAASKQVTIVHHGDLGRFRVARLVTFFTDPVNQVSPGRVRIAFNIARVSVAILTRIRVLDRTTAAR
jgi:hypothetical protein